MEQVIELYQKVVVQVSTPYSTGTGFYLKSHNLIVTNDHVVRDNRQVVIDGVKFEKQLVRVMFSDPEYDLALLEGPVDSEGLPNVRLETDTQKYEEGLSILAIAYPFGLPYTATPGQVLNAGLEDQSIHYIEHSAVSDPGYSGGPLVNAAGDVLGVNMFGALDEDSSRRSLPAHYLEKTLEAFLKGNGQIGQRCFSCGKAVFEQIVDKKTCPHCNTRISLPSEAEEYEPEGVAKTVESLLYESGYKVDLSRRGPNHWQIREGSARINISYYEKHGLIIGDAFLCNLPKDNAKPLYEFLLRQNYSIDSLTFSVKGQDIVLSLLIYDRYLNLDTGMKLFAHLFERADYYDNVLVEEYGAGWKNEED